MSRPGHHCHATGCAALAPPVMLMCRPHWRMVPKHIQAAVYESYRPGQCDDWMVSAEYCRAASDAVRAVAAKESREPDVRLYDALLKRIAQ